MSVNPAELHCDTGVEVTACLLMACRLPGGTCLRELGTRGPELWSALDGPLHFVLPFWNFLEWQ